MKIILPISDYTASWLDDTNVLDEVTEGDLDVFDASPSPVYSAGDKVVLTDIYPNKVYEWINEADSASSGVVRPDVDIAAAGASGKGVQGTYWLDIGATERWRPFDQSLTYKTGGANSRVGVSSYVTNDITYDLIAPDFVDGMAFFGLDAPQVRIQVFNGAEETYDRTVSLVDETNAVDWWEWFFGPIDFEPEVVVTDVVAYSGERIKITIGDGAYACQVGEIVVGRVSEIGVTVARTSIGAVNYDDFDRDTFGETVITPQGYTRTVDFAFSADTDDGRKIQRLLSENRSSRMVYFGGENITRTGTLVYGIVKTWNVSLDHVRSDGRLEVESVV